MMGTPSPLAIPEILEQILAYIDDDTITDTVLLVCRHWFYVARHRHIREAVWNTRYSSTTDYDSPSGIESTLPTAHRLYCYLHVGPKNQEQKLIYNRFREALIHNHNQQIGVTSRRLREQAAAATTTAAQLRQSPEIGDRNAKGNENRKQRPIRQHLASKAPPLREVVIETFAHLLHTDIYPLLPFLYSITSLTIRCVEFSAFSRLWMPHLLTWCPYVEDLRIETNRSITMAGPWFRPYVSTWDTPIADHHPKPTRLVSLVLVNVRLAHQDLQDLLEVSPRLRDLRVVVSDFAERGIVFDCEGFQQYARTFFSSNKVGALQQQHLKTFYVSVKNQVMADVDIEERMFGLCPKTNVITVQLQDFSLTLLDLLQSRPNVITNLEIVNGDGNPSEVLHSYLCRSPHLLHLSARRVGIIVEDTGRLSTEDADSTTTGPTVWACRNLRTLQACFFTRHSFDSTGSGGGGGAAVCRWVYGYISRVCPRLRHLDIANIESMEYDRISSYIGHMYSGCMALESGFCLLARLKELRWIRLGTFDAALDVSHVDLSWMLLADETGDTRRVERQQVVSTWTLGHGLGLSGNQGSTVNIADGNNLPRYMGTLLDVKKMIDEMNSVENFECWPCLQGIIICRQGGYGQDRKHEVDRLLQEAAP
ncbi:hypothetical protein BGZ96_006834 [Linnemannia gamsii]|uniref:F-box domain-containing protein n=1 Tax=Linnemannia gamsii TaxID=64522 RepID=A0ABQ7K2R4_9FUNG|nr:hypothetical protein BGZ96_006834 [Linnemannia gamsii]